MVTMCSPAMLSSARAPKSVDSTGKGSGVQRWSAGQQDRMVQLLLLWVCWIFFQTEGGSPGTTAILFTLAVYLTERPRCNRHAGRNISKALLPDVLSSAENGNSVAASLELEANQLRAGEVAPSSDGSAGKVQSGIPPATNPGAAAAAAATAADAAESAAAGTSASPAASSPAPKTPASKIAEIAVEEAVTRLAGAAELGTEALVWVRRADLAVLIDMFVEHAQSPVVPSVTVTSPALARLALVRRSRWRDVAAGSRRRVCSPNAASGTNTRRVCSPASREDPPRPALRRLGSPSFHDPRRGGGGDGSSGRRAASASPSPRAAPTTVMGGRALFQDGNVAPGRGSSSGRLTSRARSPEATLGGRNGAGVARRTRGAQEGKQGRLKQRVRSSSPSSAMAAAATAACASARVGGTTPIAIAKNCETRAAAGNVASTACGVASTTKQNKTPADPSVLAAKPCEDKATACPAPAKRRIAFTPIIQRKAGERQGDFDDFWHSGWG